MTLCTIIQLVQVLIFILFTAEQNAAGLLSEGPKLWNFLSKSLKEIPSPIKFKMKLKNFIFVSLWLKLAEMLIM